MIDVPSLTAASDVVIGLVVVVPVALVAGGVAIATRVRRKGPSSTALDTTAVAEGKQTVADPPSTAPTASALASAPDTAAPLVTEPAPEVVAPIAAEPEPASYRGRLGKARGLLSGYVGAIRAR